ncbi:Mpo1-like protein [Aquisphaera insulae]|uniref:Mpo1-like protein n=1 Tax=Aquisphaera insulae TaxID=2712864 RepID=UPI0013ED1ED4|nr:Mpo1-like protein [Aquisphaera insulae]
MVYPPQEPSPLIAHWMERHRHPVSFVFHLIGIPPTILGVLLFSIYVGLLSVPIMILSLSLFFGGFALQFAGHLLEGTDPGEVIFFKKKLGLPYVEFATQRGSAAPAPPSAADRSTGKPAAAAG